MSKNPVYQAGMDNVASRNKNLPTGDLSNGADNFYISGEVTKTPVIFKNVYGMKIAANLFTPNDLNKETKYSAIIVGAPNGAVKEQSANLYASKMAEFGFVTISFDQVFWGDSEGTPRNAMAPDFYSESFSAAADYLTTLEYVDDEKMSVLGICASGSFALNEAKIDSRLKAIATVSLTDMGAVARGIRDSLKDSNWIDKASKQRTSEKAGAEIVYTSGTPETIDENSDAFSKEFYDFYRTQRGAANTTTQPTLTSFVKLLNFYSLSDIETVSPRPLLFVAGENAISLGFSEDAYNAASEPKELYKVKGAGHVDLYDRTELIPFEKLNDFFKNSLK
ncbi:alpha/beta hydrolase [Companilactobacillus baiquanensis]|uniref:Alpha/beta hydrolase n=1 Tax=Companilactobacillus baiquanensis TaxID=2486005 RepID=A0ABW1UZB2_9LACO|nr:alpha/beta hydrolase [Companilactobacillus baiquanensis]